MYKKTKARSYEDIECKDIELEIDDKSYTITKSNLEMTIQAINVARSLDNFTMETGGMLQQASMRFQEIALTALFSRALDRFLFPERSVGACLHQGPIRKFPGRSGNPESSDVYVMPFVRDFVPYAPVLVSDIKVTEAKKETALYATCCLALNAASPLILGFPVTKTSAELFVFMPINHGWCGISVAASTPNDIALLCTVYTAVHYLCECPISYPAPLMRSMLVKRNYQYKPIRKGLSSF